MGEVHIVPTGKRFTLRVGPYHRSIDYRTAEAANLLIQTRDDAGNGLPVFDNLTRKQAESLAAKLEIFYAPYCRGNRADPKPSERQRQRDALAAKYQAAMKG